MYSTSLDKPVSISAINYIQYYFSADPSLPAFAQIKEPELIERLLLKGLIKIHRSKFEQEDRLSVHIAFINHIIEP
jgi:hypothetical protein